MKYLAIAILALVWLITPELYEEIREYAEANPGMSHQDIAVMFNVNHGRVSEAIKGKRT
jgi:hypothetical protein